ncbi:MAG: hypothetical protein ACI8RD_012506 [Bacillariaceae sp.]|jgi:hypothetical protein
MRVPVIFSSFLSFDISLIDVICHAILNYNLNSATEIGLLKDLSFLGMEKGGKLLYRSCKQTES